MQPKNIAGGILDSMDDYTFLKQRIGIQNSYA